MLVSFASAASTGMVGSYTTAMGPLNILVSLGIENFPSVSVSQAQFIYRWLTFIAVAWVAFSADKKSATIFGVLTVIVAAVCAYIGWFTVLLPNGTINPAGPWSIIILMAVLTVVSYMTEVNRIQYGLSSPGDSVIKLFTFFVIFNGCLGIMSSTYLFAGIPGMATTPPVCTTNNYANCQVNGANQLQTLSPSSSNTGGILGIFTKGWDLVSMAGSVAIQAAMLVASILLSLVFVSGTIIATFPWILGSTPAMLVLGLFQVFIYVLYVLMISRWYGKVMPGEMRI